jgi:plastocyanin
MKNQLAVPVKLISLLCVTGLLNSCSGVNETPLSKVHTVEIRAMKFQPSALTVKKGDTVLFINRDFVVHDVTEAESKRWNSMPLETDKSYRLVVNRSEGYYCSFHPVMKGSIIIK